MVRPEARTTLTWAGDHPAAGRLVGQLLVGWSSDRTGERRLHGSVPIYMGAAALACTLLIPASLSFNARLAWPSSLFTVALDRPEGVHAGVLVAAQPVPDRGRRRRQHRLDQLAWATSADSSARTCSATSRP